MQQVMKQRSQADYIAHSQPCANFGAYRPLFDKIHQELQTGHRRLDENGTETDILLQTLRKNVVSSGYAVTLPTEEAESFNMPDEVQPDDQCTGYIYVLRSLSTNPDIRNRKNLYKIGFTTQTVKERIAGAVHEPTYLMAEVEIIATYKVVNIHSQKLEHLIHTVLKQAQFYVTVIDDEGQEHHPDEWYVVQLNMVEEIIQRIVQGTILGYVYNAKLQCLEQVTCRPPSL